MFAIFASALLILLTSLLLGRAMLAVLRWPSPAWLSGAVGFAALVVVAPFLVSLPGRGVTAAVLLAAALVVAAIATVRLEGRRIEWRGWPVGVAVVAITLALALLPFWLNDRVGILGQGIYTNDHAAQLYWAEWLRNAFGPQPSAVSFGYPIGPQSLAVIVAEATGTSLITAFNGLLIAIPALTGLAALALLGRLPPGRRIAVASICGLPYLAASFYAQSAFKETAMALFVLVFAVALTRLERAGWRGVLGVGTILAVAAVFTFSIPGLVWFAIAGGLWLVAETLSGRGRIEWTRARESLAGNRVAVGVAGVIVAAVAVLAVGPAVGFIDKINDVQASAGRLSSPVFVGEAFGIWPAGDFRLVRGEVAGGLIAAALGALAAGFGAFSLVRRREWALLAMLAAGAIVYLGARLFAEIHVEAKALAVIAPLTLLVALRALLSPGDGAERRPTRVARYGFGAFVLVAATISTLLALRAAPVGYDNRSSGLEQLAERIEGESVVFLGVDRFSGYRLRGTLARAPAGYVPEEIASRPEKTWQQGLAADFDTVEPAKLDKFSYAITTAAAYGSTAPPNFERVAATGDYVLWERRGETPRARVLDDERGDPGAVLSCEAGEGARLARRRGEAVVLPQPRVAGYQDWQGAPDLEDAAGGQERAFLAQGAREVELALDPGRYALSLQYHSQAPLAVEIDGEQVARLPPSLDGMYLSAAGRGAFWPAGELELETADTVRVRVVAAGPQGLRDALGVERRVWLGDLAAVPIEAVRERPIGEACDRYVDRFSLERRGGGR